MLKLKLATLVGPRSKDASLRWWSYFFSRLLGPLLFVDWFSSSKPQLHLINFSSLMSTSSSSGVNLIQLNPKQNKVKAKLLHHFRQMQCKAPTSTFPLPLNSNQIKVSSLSLLSLNLCVVGWARYMVPPSRI